MDPAPQFSTLGEFRIEAVLGQGGSGIVYDATWGPRRVALKVLHTSLLGTGKERTQFIAEAQRLQQIMHPSVVKVLAVGQLPDGRPYLAMERLDGETLASVVARGALPLARSLEVFSELCSAVAALHAQGLIHRDLKPENVFVVADKHAVLLDFGIAKDLAAPASTTTQEGNVRGTPAYMAPERFFGQPAGITTDLYELAVVLYVMLAGRLPWDDVADPETRLSPRSLRDLAPDVPEALDIEIRRALSTRVQNRPASATALLEAVVASAAGDESDQSAASTARLRSGAHDAITAAPPAPERSASAEHQTHQTPLAWAPTVAAPQTPAPAQRRARWPIALGLGAVAIAGGAVAWWRLRDQPRTVAQAPRDAAAITLSATDPWADHGAAVASATTPPSTGSAADESPRADAQPKAFALIGDKLTPEQYRAEAAAAIAKLPPDTRLLIGIQLVDLRANTATSDLLDRFTKNPKVAMLTTMLPPCIKSILGDAEWFVFGAPSLDASQHGTFVLRGRWRRSDVEACFGDTVRTHVALDGAKLYRVGDTGWLDFLDDHTAYVTLNTKLEAESLHKLTKQPGGPVPRTKQLLAKLPAARSVMFVADGKANDDWSMLSLPKGSDVGGWLLVGTDGVTLDFSADPHDATAAAEAFARVKPQVDDVFGSADAKSVGKLEVTRDGTAVHVKGNMTSLMLGIVASAVEP